MNKVNQTKDSRDVESGGYSSWILQILLWFMILFYYILYLLEKKNEQNIILTMIVLIYILYVVTEIYSNNFSFLKNIYSVESFKKYMNTLFNSPIIIKFHCECYHYNKQNGKEIKNGKVITYKGDQNFTYNYWTDISGLLSLNENVNTDDRFIFLKLKLKREYYINDRFTNEDYKKQYDSFISKFRKIDDYISFSEITFLSDFKENILINISKKPLPLLISKWWFIFFTLIFPIAEVYSCYINSLSIVKNYSIKKQISNKFDLKKGVLSKELLKHYPKIELFKNNKKDNEDSIINISTSKDGINDVNHDNNVSTGNKEDKLAYNENKVINNSKHSCFYKSNTNDNIIFESNINIHNYDKLKQCLI